MLAPLARTLIALWICLGILAPQGAAMLSALGLANGRVLVICTGDGLRNLRLDAGGNPVELSDKAGFCALVHAADTSSPPRATAAAGRIVHLAAPSPAPADAPLRPGHPPAQPRAPPRV